MNKKGFVFIALFGSFTSFAANERVVPSETIDPPVAADSYAVKGEEIVFGAHQSCYGRNNRGTSRTLRGTADSSVISILSFSVLDRETQKKKEVVRRVIRPGDSVLAKKSPSYICTRSPSNVTGVFQKGLCSDTSQGRLACSLTGSANLNQANVSYRCVGKQHETIPELHSCSFSSNGQRVVCADHNVNGALVTHQCSRLADARKEKIGKTFKFRPATISCSHVGEFDYKPKTIVEKKKGGRWVADNQAEVSWSGSERVVVRFKGFTPSERVIEGSVRVSYEQDVPNNNPGDCAFYGCDGPLNDMKGSLPKIVNDGRAIDVSASFSGSDGFCGGFHSPLMVFFKGEKLPEFTGTSRFSMGLEGRSYSWPEKNAGGWLLARASGRSREISKESQLFGSNTIGSNGFQALAVHDENKDGVIDSKDSVFKELLLWNDKNGDSVSQKEEVSSLAEKGVVSISLEYSDSAQVDVGARAKAKQKGRFIYRLSGVKDAQEGVVYDIWFAELN